MKAIKLKFWLRVMGALEVVGGIHSRAYYWALKHAADNVEYDELPEPIEEAEPW